MVFDDEEEYWNLSGKVQDASGKLVAGGATIAKTMSVFLIGIWREGEGNKKYHQECLAKVTELQKILIEGQS